MEHVASLFKQYPPKNVTNRTTERGQLMGYFRNKLNASRLMAGYAPISMARMGKLLEQIPTKDLYYLKRVCDDARNFSSKFWYELDVEKHKV